MKYLSKATHRIASWRKLLTSPEQSAVILVGSLLILGTIVKVWHHLIH